MQTALLVISALLSALSLALVCLLLVKTKRTGGGSDAETLRRLEEKTDAIGKLTDFNTRTTENLSRSTEARL